MNRTTLRRSRKLRRCPCGTFVQPGDQYLEHVISPDHDDVGIGNLGVHPAGAPPLDYWVIPPGGYTGSHYAVYPPELCRIPIESMCPRQVCTVCRQPRRRITEQSGEYAEHRERARNVGDGQFNADNAMWTAGMSRPTARGSERVNAEYVTIGWTDCGHDSWRNGIVLDPFGGSGTTGMVAVGLGRDAICIDIDDRNADLAVERIGMFVEVEDVRTATTGEATA